MDKPKILNAGEISPERLDLYEEESVKILAEQWNEKVVQHALRGTQELLHRKLPEGPFGDGQIYFRKNHGQGHITSQNGRPQKPDWCVYQKKDGWGTKPCPNLLPGDIKPAKKWKSEWITSSDSTMRRKADLVLNQITKYMYLGGKRYGFILSEEELVAVRLSMFTRDTEALQELAQDDSAAAAHMIGSFQNLDDKSDEDFADAQRRQGRYLEYCGIPWDASGEDSFTVNLTLWWLTVLAMQDASIKSVGDYTPLSSLIRGQSPPYALPVAETEANHTQSSVGDVPGRLEPGSKKSNNLSSETPKATKRASRRYRGERQEILSGGNSSLSATQGACQPRGKEAKIPDNLSPLPHHLNHPNANVVEPLSHFSQTHLPIKARKLLTTTPCRFQSNLAPGDTSPHSSARIPHIIDCFAGGAGNAQSEDCLILTIWTEPNKAAVVQSKPVLIFFYDGSFANGNTCSPFYDGQSMADAEDVVVVMLNYQIDFFGFSPERQVR
ncbi:hypothetical protein PG988_006044 [Apiospora saccharicola]